MTSNLGILNRRGVEGCKHPSPRWDRDRETLFRYCTDCFAILETDTVATSLPANPSLANQVDPDELRALGQRE